MSALDERQISVIVYIIIYIQNVTGLFVVLLHAQKISVDLMATGGAGRISFLGRKGVDVHSPTKFGKCVHRSNNVQRLIKVMGNQSMKFGLRCH